MTDREIHGFDKQGGHLKDREQNLAWMKSTYSTRSYWEDDLRYGNRWKRDGTIKDYRQTGEIIDRYVKPFLPSKIGHALEIGPGGGRWTPGLLRIAPRVSLMDLSAPAIEICRERFKYYDNVSYHVGSGADLSPIETASIDFVFSWGVFVHIEKTIIADYAREIRRVLTPTGRAFVQHAAIGASVRQSRTDFHKGDIEEIAAEAGLTIVAQIMFSKGVYPEHRGGRVAAYLDCLTVVEPEETTDH